MTYCKANSCYDSTNYSYDDYCSYHERCLSKLRGEKYIPNIQEIETFETWFNGNCGYVINYDNSRYNVWIVVCEPKQWNKDIPENWLITMNDYWYSLDTAREKAQNLRDKLKYSDNPILHAHSNADSYTSFSNVVTTPFVENNLVGSSTKTVDIPLFYVDYDTSLPGNLDRHFRPLDIVWVKCLDNWIGKRFYHVGVYLGDGRICHFTGKHEKVKITSDWSEFLDGTVGKLRKYHPIIPFKEYRDIIRQVVWAKDNNFRGGNYNLPNRNCEHLANMLVYGIDFSQQVHERKADMIVKASVQSAGFGTAGGVIAGASVALAPFTFGLSLIPGVVGTSASVYGIIDNAVENGTLNNGKNEICLEREIRDTNSRLGRKSDWETEKYEKQYLQEVPPKEYCRIM